MARLLDQSFTVIEEYFSKLNDDPDHFQNSNDICTPLGCVKEMVDSIPVSFWQKDTLKILDSCCGNGNFHAYIQKLTDINNLYFNEINSTRIGHVKNLFGDKVNLTEEDFLSFPDVEEYDLVVSNPPYAKFNGDKRASKNHNMSRSFILKAINITKPGGYVLFIAPDNWMSYSDRNVLPKIMSEYQFIHLNIHGAKKWFPRIGSSFTWFLMQKVPNQRSFTIENNYVRKDVIQATLSKSINFIPLYYSDMVRRIFDKVVLSSSSKYQVETTSYLHRYTKKDLISETESADHKYRLIHTPSQTVWSNKPHKYQKGWKVFLSLTDKYKIFIDKDCGMTQSTAFIRCASKRDAEKTKQELDKPIYRFINNLTRYGNFNNIRVLQNLSIWDKVELTSREEEFITNFLTYNHGNKEIQ